MIEQVKPDIFRIEVPLPNNPLRATNSYFVRGQERNLLIDNGFNCPESRQAMDEALKDLAIDTAKTDLFITHLHSDHAGLTGHIATSTSRVLISENDGRVVAAGQGSIYWQQFNSFMHFSGLVDDGMKNDVAIHPGFRYGSAWFGDFIPVREDDEIAVGRYKFRCVMVPGHTKGQVCLYEPEHKLLVAGDHILGKITPNISLWQIGGDDVLGQYLQSLDKIARLEVDLVLPGHRHLIPDCRGRIEELKQHHAKRLHEVWGLLGERQNNATDIARLMNWDLSIKQWQDFPWAQKLFAVSEAMSHLYHLCQTVQATVSQGDDGIYYFRRQ